MCICWNCAWGGADNGSHQQAEDTNQRKILSVQWNAGFKGFTRQIDPHEACPCIPSLTRIIGFGGLPSATSGAHPVSITFRIKREVQYGCTLIIIGSQPISENWNISKVGLLSATAHYGHISLVPFDHIIFFLRGHWQNMSSVGIARFHILSWARPPKPVQMLCSCVKTQPFTSV